MPQVPVGAVRESDTGQVPQVVPGLTQLTPQLVNGAGLLARGVVGDLGTPAQGVHAGGQAPRRRVLHAPHPALGVGAGHAQAGVVVTEGGGVPQGRNSGDNAPGLVPDQAVHPSGGVGHARQVTVGVIGQAHGDPGGILQPGQEGAVPPQAGDPALGVGDDARVAVLALVLVAGDAHGAVPGVPGPSRPARPGGGREPDLGEPVPLVPHGLGTRAGGALLQGETTPVVKETRSAAAVAFHHHDLVAPPVPARPLRPAVAVRHADQAAPVVMDPGIGTGAVLVGDHGHPAGQVGVVGEPPPTRRDLVVTRYANTQGMPLGAHHLRRSEALSVGRRRRWSRRHGPTGPTRLCNDSHLSGWCVPRMTRPPTSPSV